MNLNSAIPDNIQAIAKEEKELLELERGIQDRRKKIASAKKAIDTSSTTHKLAISMHQHLCKWNHTDGCAWQYHVKNGIHDWNNWEHQEWLKRAAKVMKYVETNPVTSDNVLDFLDTVFKI